MGKFIIKEFIEFINQGVKCDKKCPCHKFVTHNVCLTCKALKDSPYHQEYLKDKTDKEIAKEVKRICEEEL